MYIFKNPPQKKTLGLVVLLEISTNCVKKN